MKNNIGERIRNRRIELRISQDELARRAGYSSRSSINKIEKSVRDMPQGKIIMFAKALNTSPLYLLGETEDPSPVYNMNLSKEEKDLVTQYRNSNEQTRRLVAYALKLGEMEKKTEK